MKRKTNHKEEYVFAMGEVPEIDIPEIQLRYIPNTNKPFSVQIKSSVMVVDVLRQIIGDDMELREQIIVLYLNAANKVLGYYRHTTGGITNSLVDIRLILATALKSLSTSIILCHNHPSGNLKPSPSDIKLTSNLKTAAKQMDIELLDHIIVTKESYYSLADGGEMSLYGIKKVTTTKSMKTPITYYGGKQSLLKHLLPLIPPHKLYCEPFFGGGALFFAKPSSETEVINDLNGEVVNFFKVVKTKFAELQKEVQGTLHSRELFKRAKAIYDFPDMFTDVKRAWAFWVLTNQGFAGMIGSWGFGKDNSKEKSLINKRADFMKSYAERLESVQIEHNNALKVIDRCDDKEAFIYCDPPYINSDQGHYAGYGESEYKLLLDKLAKLKGKFLLSSYPSTLLNTYIKKYKWRVQKVSKAVAVTKHTNKQKVEMMVFNYDEKNAGKFTSSSEIKSLESQLKQLKFD
jgi:DNA adenine methylase